MAVGEIAAEQKEIAAAKAAKAAAAAALLAEQKAADAKAAAAAKLKTAAAAKATLAQEVAAIKAKKAAADKAAAAKATAAKKVVASVAVKKAAATTAKIVAAPKTAIPRREPLERMYEPPVVSDQTWKDLGTVTNGASSSASYVEAARGRLANIVAQRQSGQDMALVISSAVKLVRTPGVASAAALEKALVQIRARQEASGTQAVDPKVIAAFDGVYDVFAANTAAKFNTMVSEIKDLLGKNVGGKYNPSDANLAKYNAILESPKFKQAEAEYFRLFGDKLVQGSYVATKNLRLEIGLKQREYLQQVAKDTIFNKVDILRRKGETAAVAAILKDWESGGKYLFDMVKGDIDPQKTGWTRSEDGGLRRRTVEEEFTFRRSQYLADMKREQIAFQNEQRAIDVSIGTETRQIMGRKNGTALVVAQTMVALGVKDLKGDADRQRVMDTLMAEWDTKFRPTFFSNKANPSGTPVPTDPNYSKFKRARDEYEKSLYQFAGASPPDLLGRFFSTGPGKGLINIVALGQGVLGAVAKNTATVAVGRPAEFVFAGRNYTYKDLPFEQVQAYNAEVNRLMKDPTFQRTRTVDGKDPVVLVPQNLRSAAEEAAFQKYGIDWLNDTPDGQKWRDEKNLLGAAFGVTTGRNKAEEQRIYLELQNYYTKVLGPNATPWSAVEGLGEYGQMPFTPDSVLANLAASLIDPAIAVPLKIWTWPMRLAYAAETTKGLNPVSRAAKGFVNFQTVNEAELRYTKFTNGLLKGLNPENAAAKLEQSRAALAGIKDLKGSAVEIERIAKQLGLAPNTANSQQYMSLAEELVRTRFKDAGVKYVDVAEQARIVAKQRADDAAAEAVRVAKEAADARAALRARNAADRKALREAVQAGKARADAVREAQIRRAKLKVAREEDRLAAAAAAATPTPVAAVPTPVTVPHVPVAAVPTPAAAVPTPEEVVDAARVREVLNNDRVGRPVIETGEPSRSVHDTPYARMTGSDPTVHRLEGVPFFSKKDADDFAASPEGKKALGKLFEGPGHLDDIDPNHPLLGALKKEVAKKKPISVIDAETVVHQARRAYNELVKIGGWDQKSIDARTQANKALTDAKAALKKAETPVLRRRRAASALSAEGRHALEEAGRESFAREYRLAEASELTLEDGMIVFNPHGGVQTDRGVLRSSDQLVPTQDDFVARTGAAADEASKKLALDEKAAVAGMLRRLVTENKLVMTSLASGDAVKIARARARWGKFLDDSLKPFALENSSAVVGDGLVDGLDSISLPVGQRIFDDIVENGFVNQRLLEGYYEPFTLARAYDSEGSAMLLDPMKISGESTFLDPLFRMGFGRYAFQQLMQTPIFLLPPRSPKIFRDTASNLFILFHLSLRDGPGGIARLEGYARVIGSVLAADPDNIYARMWRVMEVRAGVPWAKGVGRGFIESETLFKEAILANADSGIIPGLALAMIPYGPIARAVPTQWGFFPRLAGMARSKSKLFAAAPAVWTDQVILKAITIVADGARMIRRAKTERLTGIVTPATFESVSTEMAMQRASQIIHAIATRYGNTFERAAFLDRLRDKTLQNLAAELREDPALMARLREEYIVAPTNLSVHDQGVFSHTQGANWDRLMNYKPDMGADMPYGYGSKTAISTDALRQLDQFLSEKYATGVISHKNGPLHTLQLYYNLQSPQALRSDLHDAIWANYQYHMKYAEQQTMAAVVERELRMAELAAGDAKVSIEEMVMRNVDDTDLEAIDLIHAEEYSKADYYEREKNGAPYALNEFNDLVERVGIGVEDLERSDIEIDLLRFDKTEKGERNWAAAVARRRVVEKDLFSAVASVMRRFDSGEALGDTAEAQLREIVEILRGEKSKAFWKKSQELGDELNATSVIAGEGLVVTGHRPRFLPVGDRIIRALSDWAGSDFLASRLGDFYQNEAFIRNFVEQQALIKKVADAGEIPTVKPKLGVDNTVHTEEYVTNQDYVPWKKDEPKEIEPFKDLPVDHPETVTPHVTDDVRLKEAADYLASRPVRTTQPHYGVTRIISGGQTGGDRGGLLAGRALGIETGGTVPKGWKTERGAEPGLADFGLKEHASASYVPRTMKNVDDADATIAFLAKDSVGTGKTIGYAQTGEWRYGTGETKVAGGHRPVLVITEGDVALGADHIAKRIRYFLDDLPDAKTLNIAGHRETSVPGIEKLVQESLEKALRSPVPPSAAASPPARPVAKAVNIWSGSDDSLAAALTNPTVLSRRKGKVKSDYPVTDENGKVWPDVESAYKAGQEGRGPTAHNLDLMRRLLTLKLRQHPRLIEGIDARGGRAYLERASHRVNGKSTWEGVGINSPFIKTLIEAYDEVTARAAAAPPPDDYVDRVAAYRTGVEGTGDYRPRKDRPIYHGTSETDASSFVDEDGNLHLKASRNYNGQQEGVSFTTRKSVAVDYATRTENPKIKRGSYLVFEIDPTVFRKGALYTESGEEVATQGMDEVIIPAGRFKAHEFGNASQYRAEAVTRYREMSDEDLVDSWMAKSERSEVIEHEGSDWDVLDDPTETALFDAIRLRRSTPEGRESLARELVANDNHFAPEDIEEAYREIDRLPPSSRPVSPPELRRPAAPPAAAPVSPPPVAPAVTPPPAAAAPPPVAPSPSSLSSPELEAALQQLKILTGMSEEQWVASELRKALALLPSLPPDRAKKANAYIKDLRRAQLVLQAAKKGGIYISPKMKTIFKNRQTRAAGTIPSMSFAPGRISPYVTSVAGAQTEMVRSFFHKLRTASVLGQTRTSLMGKPVSADYVKHGVQLDHLMDVQVGDRLLKDLKVPQSLRKEVTAYRVLSDLQGFEKSLGDIRMVRFTKELKRRVNNELGLITGNPAYRWEDYLDDRLKMREHYYDYRTWEQHWEIVRQEIVKARDGVRNQYATRYPSRPSNRLAISSRTENLESDIRAVIAKAKALEGVGSNSHRYNEAYKVFNPSFQKRNSAVKFIKEATARATAELGVSSGKVFDDLRDKYFFEIRQAAVSVEADKQFANLIRRRPGASIDDLVAEFEKDYGMTGSPVGLKPDEISEFQALSLEEAIKSLTGVTDPNDLDQMRGVLSANGQGFPSENGALARTELVRRGTWSPRTAEAIEAGKTKSWSIFDEASWHLDNYAFIPERSNPALFAPGGKYELALHSPELYSQLMRDWGMFSRNMEARFASGKMTRVDLAKMIANGDPTLKVHAARDLPLIRKFVMDRFGSLASPDGVRLIAFPQFMTPEELRPYFMSRLKLGIPDGLVRNEEQLDAVLTALEKYMGKYFDDVMSGARKEASYEDLFLIASQTVHEVLNLPFFKNPATRPQDATNIFLRTWQSFWQNLVFTNFGFATTNYIDSIIKETWERAQTGSFRTGTVSERAAKVTLYDLGLDIATQLFRDVRTIGAPRVKKGIDKFLESSGTGWAGVGDMAVGVWQVPAQLAGKAEQAAKLRLAQSMYDEVYERLLRQAKKGRVTDEVADEIAHAETLRFLKEEVSRMWPTVGDGLLEKIFNQLCPFFSYQIKNRVLFLGEALNHPAIFNWLDRIGAEIERYNRQEWAKRNPDDPMALMLDPASARKIELPWAPGLFIDFGSFTDFQRGYKPFSDMMKGEMTLRDFASTWLRLVSPSQQNVAGAILNAFDVPMRMGWEPILDADGFATGKYRRVKVPWNAPWGGKADFWASFWPAELLSEFMARSMGGLDVKDITMMASQAFLFSAIKQPDPGLGLNLLYYSLKAKDPKAAKSFLDSDQGTLLRAYWLSKASQIRNGYTPQEVADILDPPGDKNVWWDQTPEWRAKVQDGWDRLDVIDAKWDHYISLLEPGSDEMKEAKLRAATERYQFLHDNPELIDAIVLGRTPEDWANTMKGWELDNRMQGYFNIKAPNRDDFKTIEEYRVAQGIYDMARSVYLVAFPQVAQALAASRSSLDNARFSVQQGWFDLLNSIGTRDHAMEAAKEAENYDLLDQLYMINELQGRQLDQDFAFNYFNPVTDYRRLPKGVLGPTRPVVGLVPLVRVFPDFTTWRVGRMSEPEKIEYRETEKYVAGMRRVIGVAKKGGDFDAATFVTEMKKDPWLLNRYFEATPGKREEWAWNDKYISTISVFGKLMAQGKFTEAYRYFDAMPDAVKARYYSVHPEAKAARIKGLQYMNYMEKWVGFMKRKDFAGGAAYFDSLPKWVQDKYLLKNPKTPYQIAMGQWSALIEAGNEVAAQRFFDALPASVKAEYYKTHPYAKAMSQWAALMEKGDMEAAQKFFDALPSDVKATYFKTHPYAKAMSEWGALLDKGDEATANAFFDALPQEFKNQYWAKNPYAKAMNEWGKIIASGNKDASFAYFNAMPQAYKDKYFLAHPDSKMKGYVPKVYKSRPRSGGGTQYTPKTGTGWINYPPKTGTIWTTYPTTSTSPYSLAMKGWVDLLKAGDSAGAKKYFDALPQEFKDIYYKNHPDVALRNDIKRTGQLALYFAASDAGKTQYLTDNPEFAQWLYDNDTSEAKRTMLITAAYEGLGDDDQWLKRVFREKYPEVFSEKAEGLATLNKVYASLEANPGITPAFEKWSAAIWASYAQAMQHSKPPPPMVESVRRPRMDKRPDLHAGMSAEWVRKHSTG